MNLYWLNPASHCTSCGRPYEVRTTKVINFGASWMELLDSEKQPPREKIDNKERR